MNILRKKYKVYKYIKKHASLKESVLSLKEKATHNLSYFQITRK